MKKQEAIEAIRDFIEDMDDGEAVSLWNEYCDNASRYDDRIEYMESLSELYCDLDGDGLFNLLNRFYFGHDENDEKSSANPNRDYFYYNGYGNIVTTDYPKDCIEAAEIAEWIVEREDALYNDDIQEILDEMGEDEDD